MGNNLVEKLIQQKLGQFHVTLGKFILNYEKNTQLLDKIKWSIDRPFEGSIVLKFWRWDM